MADVRKRKAKKSRPPFVPPADGRDVIMTVEDVAELLQESVNSIYKRNAVIDFPVYKIGKQCRYLYSEVMNWFLNQDTRIKDDPSSKVHMTINELPKCWPPPKRPTDTEVA